MLIKSIVQGAGQSQEKLKTNWGAIVFSLSFAKQDILKLVLSGLFKFIFFFYHWCSGILKKNAIFGARDDFANTSFINFLLSVEVFIIIQINGFRLLIFYRKILYFPML